MNFKKERISLSSTILHLHIWFRSHKKSKGSLEPLIYDPLDCLLVTYLKHKTNLFITFFEFITLAIKGGHDILLRLSEHTLKSGKRRKLNLVATDLQLMKLPV